MRYVMRIADSRESSNLWMHPAPRELFGVTPGTLGWECVNSINWEEKVVACLTAVSTALSLGVYSRYTDWLRPTEPRKRGRWLVSWKILLARVLLTKYIKQSNLAIPYLYPAIVKRVMLFRWSFWSLGVDEIVKSPDTGWHTERTPVRLKAKKIFAFYSFKRINLNKWVKDGEIGAIKSNKPK